MKRMLAQDRDTSTAVNERLGIRHPCLLVLTALVTAAVIGATDANSQEAQYKYCIFISGPKDVVFNYSSRFCRYDDRSACNGWQANTLSPGGRDYGINTSCAESLNLEQAVAEVRFDYSGADGFQEKTYDLEPVVIFIDSDQKHEMVPNQYCYHEGRYHFAWSNGIWDLFTGYPSGLIEEGCSWSWPD